MATSERVDRIGRTDLGALDDGAGRLPVPRCDVDDACLLPLGRMVLDPVWRVGRHLQATRPLGTGQDRVVYLHTRAAVPWRVRLRRVTERRHEPAQPRAGPGATSADGRLRALGRR